MILKMPEPENFGSGSSETGYVNRPTGTWKYTDTKKAVLEMAVLSPAFKND